MVFSVYLLIQTTYIVNMRQAWLHDSTVQRATHGSMRVRMTREVAVSFKPITHLSPLLNVVPIQTVRDDMEFGSIHSQTPSSPYGDLKSSDGALEPGEQPSDVIDLKRMTTTLPESHALPDRIPLPMEGRGMGKPRRSMEF